MNFERIFAAAKNTPPSAEQLAEWAKHEAEMGPNDYDRLHPDKTPKSALTGWDGRTLDVDNVQYASGYAERGYSDPKSAVLFGNWNHVSRRVQDILERAGYELEWEDEWMTCQDCGKAVRSQADCYSWQPSYVLLNDCEVVCLDCLNGNAEDFLADLEDKPSKALNVQGKVNPEDYGYTLVKDGLENGWYGTEDDPVAIHKALHDTGHRGILFEVDGVGQFNITFKAWAKQVPDPLESYLTPEQ